MSTAIVYHEGCIDGFTAYYAAQEIIERKKKGSPCYGVEFNYEAPPSAAKILKNPDDPDLDKPDAIYFVDCVPSQSLYSTLSLNCPTVVLDHHESSRKACSKFYGIHDMHLSGATLVYKYFREHPTLLAQYVEDYDIFNLKMERSKQVHAFLSVQPMNLCHWSELDYVFTHNLSIILEKSRIIYHAIENIAEDAAKQSRVIFVNDSPVNMIPLPSKKLIGPMTDAIYNNGGTGLICFYREMETGKLVLSLRSRPGDKITALAFAERLGGGGHVHAAGCKAPRSILQGGRRPILKEIV